MPKAVVFQPGEPPRLEEVPDFDALKRLIPGYLQHVPFGPPAPTLYDCALFCDEDGKSLGLAFNREATEFFTKTHPIGFIPGDYLVGTVVVLGTLDQDGDYDAELHDAPDWLLELLNLATTQKE